MTDINEIATIASRMYARTSCTQDAINHIKTIMADDHYTAEFLAPIYAYMIRRDKAPSKKAATDSFAWVYSAVGKKYIHSSLTHTYSDGRRLIGTDGATLHVAYDVVLPAGWYDRNGVRLDDSVHKGGRYPEIDRVIPQDDLVTWDTAIGELELIVPEDKTPSVYKMPCGRLINAEYLRNAVAGVPDRFEYRAQADTDRAIKIEYGQRVAVIMPVRGGPSYA